MQYYKAFANCNFLDYANHNLLYLPDALKYVSLTYITDIMIYDSNTILMDKLGCLIICINRDFRGDRTEQI